MIKFKLKIKDSLFILLLFFNQTANPQLVSSLANLNHNNQVKLSILIATIKIREKQFNQLYQKILNQIKELNLLNQVEILYFQDNQTNSVGYKRNYLIDQALGEYVCFIDDDDDVHEYYIKLIYDALKTEPDCVSCTGIIYQPNQKPIKFVHSLKYHKAVKLNHVLCSPVYHLNPVKKIYAAQAKFPEQNYNEDTTWAKRLYQLKLLKTEVEIKTPYYFYYYDYQKSQAIPACAQHNRNIKWNAKGQLVVNTKQKFY